MQLLDPLRLLLLYLGYALLAVAYALVALLLAWFLPLTGRMALVAWFTRAFVVWLRWSVGIRISCSGWEHIRPGNAYVVAANHQSALETLYLQTLINPTCTILKKELYWLPLFGWVLFLIQPIALDRAQRVRALKSILRLGKAKLSAGVSVLIFPQGTRVAPGELGKWNKAAALLAVSNQVPILPVAHNCGECWRKGIKKRAGVVHFQIGAPLEPDADGVDGLHQRLMAFMQARLPLKAEADTEA